MIDERTFPWGEPPFRNAEEQRLFEEERFVLSVTGKLEEAMEARRLSRADLAERLETSRANVTQLLSGTRNMTLRTLARLAFELEQRIEVQMSSLDQIAFTPLDLPEPVFQFGHFIMPDVMGNVSWAQSTMSTTELADTTDFQLAA